MLKWILLTVAAVLGLAMLVKGDAGTLTGLGEREMMGLVVSGALLLFVGSSLLFDYRGRVGQAVRDFFTWVAIGVALVAVYTFRGELSEVAYRVAGELLPPGQGIVQSGEPGERAVRIRRRGDTHFIARAEVNGAPLSLLVDTGASSVVLKPADAQAAGIDTSRLVYSVAVQTANGTAYAAPVRLRVVAVGPIRLQAVDALVAQPGSLRESLLGMSFLRRLRSYEFSGDFLTLRG
jgi:aspartyl protease family protein